MMALLFCDFTSLRISWAISWLRSGSRLAVGLSARISCVLPMKARAIAALLLVARHVARILGAGCLESQVRHEGSDLGLTRGLVLVALELSDQLELIADAHVGQELVVLEDKTQ